MAKCSRGGSFKMTSASFPSRDRSPNLRIQWKEARTFIGCNGRGQPPRPEEGFMTREIWMPGWCMKTSPSVREMLLLSCIYRRSMLMWNNNLLRVGFLLRNSYTEDAWKVKEKLPRCLSRISKCRHFHSIFQEYFFCSHKELSESIREGFFARALFEFPSVVEPLLTITPPSRIDAMLDKRVCGKETMNGDSWQERNDARRHLGCWLLADGPFSSSSYRV